ncbi:MAG TPA: hypothetical protein VFY16_02345, partial [Gemmatimonadaceae bacterium]|nr:hypothetical protein [Gemmatimonadaceae bacterium]
MTHSHRFVEEFSRFLRLLHDEPAAVVAQKEALRGARDAARDGDVVLAVGADGPTLNGVEPHTLPSSVAGALRALAARLSYHGLRELRVYAGVVAAELLTAGRRLAADDALADLATLRSLENVRLVARPAGSFATPARPTPSVVRPFRAPAHDAAALRSAAAIAAQPATPRPFGTPVHGSVVIPATERSDEIIVHAAPAADDRALDLAQLFERLAACTSSKAATRYLDELATRLEEGVRRGKTEL